ncbi:MAG: carbonic anhydrase [Rhodospirillales bacterium]|nr:carbonic anhydrase [Rhodospirillales bacterium]
MTVDNLIEGFGAFRNRYFDEDPALFSDLVEHGQHPKVAIVACADSRVSPSVLLQSPPGSLFVIRNVANMVPPPDAARGNATIAGLEYAVLGLGVEHIVVLGHSHCGGIHALVQGRDETVGQFPHVTQWVSAFEKVRETALENTAGKDQKDIARTAEQAAIRVSLGHLGAFPWVRERISDGRLNLHGWYFDLAAGHLSGFDSAKGEFVELV